LKTTEKKVNMLEEICTALQGLKKTKEEFLIHKGKKPKPYPSWYYYPGKYSTAYYYALSIDHEIETAEDFKPHISRACPVCSREVPVMVSYEQAYDSPDGDLWTTKAFIICCDAIHTLKTKNYET